MEQSEKNTGERMTPRYKYLPQENDIKFKIIRKDKYAFYFFAVTIGTDFQLDLSLLDKKSEKKYLGMSDDSYSI